MRRQNTKHLGAAAMIKEQLKGDSIFLIHRFLSPDVCASLIERAETIGFDEATITTLGGPVMRKDVRNNERVILDDSELAADWWQSASQWLPAGWTGWRAVGLNERFRFYRYDPGQYFAPHVDGFFQRDHGERSLYTFMVYLNDAYEGGSTNFLEPTPPIEVRPAAGTALVFAHAQMHEGAPLVRGRKYVLRTDVMYRQVEG